MRKVLPQSFFHRSAPRVARELLGKYLARRVRGRIIADMITETEAYDGPHDRASHASRGKTARNAPMFEAGGVWYVYFVYGAHWMLNAVTDNKKYPSAVLLRGTIRAKGPGRLTKQFHITGAENELPISKQSGLWVEDRGVRVRQSEIVKTPRIGVAYAGKVWAKKPYRFILRNAGTER